MDNESRIQMWGTSNNGDGYVQDLGIYDSIYDIIIRPGMFAQDMVIEFEYVPSEKCDYSHEDYDKRRSEAEDRDRSFDDRITDSECRSIYEQLDDLNI